MQCLTSRFSNLHQASLTSLKASQPYTAPIGFSSKPADQLKLPTPETMKEYSRCLNQQGLEALKQETPDFERAFHFFDDAKTLDETAIARAGEVRESYLQHLPDLARDFSNMASVYLKQKDYIKAENCLEEALDLYQKLAYKNAVSMGEEYTPVYLVPVSIALQKLAQVYIDCAMDEKANLRKPSSSLHGLRSIKDLKKTLFRTESGFLERAQCLLQEADYIRHTFLMAPDHRVTEEVKKRISQDHQNVKKLLRQIDARILADKTLALNTQALQHISFPEPAIKRWIQEKNVKQLQQYYQQAHQTAPGQRSMQQIEHAIGLLNNALKQDLRALNTTKYQNIHIWSVIRDNINLGLVHQLGYELLRKQQDLDSIEQAEVFQNAADEHYHHALSILKMNNLQDQAQNALIVLNNNYAALLMSCKQYEDAKNFFAKAFEQLNKVKNKSGPYTIDQYTLCNNLRIFMETLDAHPLFKKLNQAKSSLQHQAKVYGIPLHRTEGPLGLLALHEEW